MRIEESIVFLKITAILYGKYVDNSDKLKLKSKLDKALTLQKEKQKLHLEQLSMSEEDRVIKVVCELVDDKDLYRRCSYKDKALYEDYDRIGEYFERHVCRPMKNIMTGSETRDKEFFVPENGEDDE